MEYVFMVIISDKYRGCLYCLDWFKVNVNIGDFN